MIRYFAREKNCQYIAFGMGSGNTQMELTWIGKGSQTVPPPPSRNRAIPARTHHAEPLSLDASPPRLDAAGAALRRSYDRDFGALLLAICLFPCMRCPCPFRSCSPLTLSLFPIYISHNPW